MFYSVMMLLWRNKLGGAEIKGFSLQWKKGKVVLTGHLRLKGWKRLGAYGEKITNVGRGMIASGRPFKDLTTSLEGWPQQCSVKVGLSVYVCGEQFKENKTLKRNLSESEESWRNDDKMLLLGLTSSAAV